MARPHLGAGHKMRQIGDHELLGAATVLVKTALRVTAGERFVAVGDLESQAILEALERAARDAGAEAAALRLDQLRSHSTNHSGDRPHKVLPDAVRRALLSAQASAFVASSPHAESSMRDQVLHIVGACRLRHAHMPGISPLAFGAGLSEDYAAIASDGKKLLRRLEDAVEITSESPDGTRLALKGPADKRWIARLGEAAPGEATYFPAGSLVACPDNVFGTFAATASVGEFFGAREGLLREPLLFEIRDGKVTGVTAPNNPHLVRDVESMLTVAPNSDRVGLVVLGVNAGVGDPTGEVNVDQHRPGLHLVLGDPAGKLTGATWSARTSFAVYQARSTVRADGQLLVDAGRLAV
jgi:leucyl aminopeptidase (aminopeptidase T)